MHVEGNGDVRKSEYYYQTATIIQYPLSLPSSCLSLYFLESSSLLPSLPLSLPPSLPSSLPLSLPPLFLLYPSSLTPLSFHPLSLSLSPFPLPHHPLFLLFSTSLPPSLPLLSLPLQVLIHYSTWCTRLRLCWKRDWSHTSGATAHPSPSPTSARSSSNTETTTPSSRSSLRR